MKLKIYNQEGEMIREEDFADNVFSHKVKNDLIHQVLVAQQNNERQVLAHTKTRGDVSGGGKKPWKQKGTGRARVGSSRSPLWKGGGVTFGPRNDRNFSQKINKKMKQTALCGVLSDRVANNALIVLDKMEVKEAKTKEFGKIVGSIEKNILKVEDKKTKRNILFFVQSIEDNLKRSGRNLANIKILNQENINIVDLLKYRLVVMTLDGVRAVEKQYKKD